MSLPRRDFLRRVAQYGGSAMLAPSLSGLAAWNAATPAMARAAAARRTLVAQSIGYGPLVPSVTCPEFEIPREFHCVRISEALQPSPVRPSFIVTNAFDGMASFRLPNGNTRLIRNHEMVDSAARAKPMAPKAYDMRAAGGTSSLEVRMTGTGNDRRVEVIDEFVSLAGTHNNCAGGPTPWNSWLSCEENVNGPPQGFEKPHGYIFEVPVSASGPVDPEPLRAMGRFVHEAVAVDPRTGIVYETEDMRYAPGNPALPGSGFYRFLPKRAEHLEEGGRLQILGIKERPRYNTTRAQAPGVKLPAVWFDIEDADPAGVEGDASTLLREGLSKGAAIFQRLEGCFYADDSIYFVSTSGGNASAGQVWQYRPTSENEGEVALVFESPSPLVLDAPDNICVGPSGRLVLCEDGGTDQFVRELTRQGEIIDLVKAPLVQGQPGPREFAGACMSADGSVLFFNVQGGTNSLSTRPSRTYALWGPW